MALLVVRNTYIMKYAYEDMSDEQFERLVVIICQHIMGISTQGFAKGPDGGRDAKFIGTAELFPSRSSPWVGTTIIQAKHTNGYNRNCSESDFYNKEKKTNPNTVIGAELLRIKKLKDKGELDNYVLFTNRRLTGNAESEICKTISDYIEVDIASVKIIDINQIELYLKRYPEIMRIAELDPIDSPLIVSPDDLAEVIQAFANQARTLERSITNINIERTTYARKNQLNNMTEAYANELKRRYLKDVNEIESFLSLAENTALRERYELAAEEFCLNIIAKRKDYQTFDDIMNYLSKLLVDREPILRQAKHKRLVNVMLFFMYWSCDIGENEDAKAQ